jgi:hypothetical protein
MMMRHTFEIYSYSNNKLTGRLSLKLGDGRYFGCCQVDVDEIDVVFSKIPGEKEISECNINEHTKDFIRTFYNGWVHKKSAAIWFI